MRLLRAFKDGVRMSGSILLVVGTRPEGIKMIPLYYALKKAQIPVLLCSNNQHSELLQEVFTIFNVRPDIEFSVMKPGQDLFHITASTLENIKNVLKEYSPSWVVVQGDTTTAMGAALGAFYSRIPVAHLEAGLRTNSVQSPYPEEFNRRVISTLASLHFAPTALAAGNLLAERIERSSIMVTGNTVVDALYIMKDKFNRNELLVDDRLKKYIAQKKNKYTQSVLVTAHRRESFGAGLINIVSAIKKLAQERSDILFFYPYHPNPAVLKALGQVDLTHNENIILCKPLSYANLVYLLLEVDWVATDSGGICEEAVSLGKPVLILRNETERMEAVWSGIAQLTGTDYDQLLYYMYLQADAVQKKTTTNTLYGDGTACEKIVSIFQQILENKNYVVHGTVQHKQASI
jgi:UDP-N-acetylglucosamine 2-epimerase (non-hydrolysing)